MAALLLALALIQPSPEDDEVRLPPVSVPALPASASTVEAFVPQGWRIETRAEGDLDRDGRTDLALVLRTARPIETTTPYGMSAGQVFDSSPRILAALLARQGGYRLALQNHRLIPRPDSSTQAEWMFEEGSLSIERGAIVVALSHFGSSVGTSIFRLRWQDDAFRLIGYDFSDVHRYSHCTNTVSINYLTRRMRITHADDGESPERESWRRLPQRSLLGADEIGEGTRFHPEGAVSGISCA